MPKIMHFNIHFPRFSGFPDSGGKGAKIRCVKWLWKWPFFPKTGVSGLPRPFPPSPPLPQAGRIFPKMTLYFWDVHFGTFPPPGPCSDRKKHILNTHRFSPFSRFFGPPFFPDFPDFRIPGTKKGLFSTVFYPWKCPFFPDFPDFRIPGMKKGLFSW